MANDCNNPQLAGVAQYTGESAWKCTLMPGQSVTLKGEGALVFIQDAGGIRLSKRIEGVFGAKYDGPNVLYIKPKTSVMAFGQCADFTLMSTTSDAGASIDKLANGPPSPLSATQELRPANYHVLSSMFVGGGTTLPKAWPVLPKAGRASYGLLHQYTPGTTSPAAWFKVSGPGTGIYSGGRQDLNVFPSLEPFVIPLFLDVGETTIVPLVIDQYEAGLSGGAWVPVKRTTSDGTLNIWLIRFSEHI